MKATISKKRMSLFKKWLFASTFTLLIFYSSIAIIGIMQDIDLARGNSYIAEHIIEHIIYSLQSSVPAALISTATIGQIVFWITHLIYENMLLKQKIKGDDRIFIAIIPFMSLIFAIIILILTVPLWFHL